MTVIEAAAEAQKPIGLCLTCNYPLWGLPTPRCPECGREFDPLDPATMNMGRELTPLAKWALGPLRWPVSVLTWGSMAYAIWMARLPGGQIAGSASIWILLALGVFWLCWPIIRWMMATNYGWPHSLLMRGQKQRIFIGVALLLASAAIVYHLPLKAALYVSRPAMDKLAADLAASNEFYGDDQWVGVYYATRIRKLSGGAIRITCEESNRAYRSGFIYLPNVDPAKPPPTNWQHVGGKWWAWRTEG